MAFHKIDMDSWPRREIYEYFHTTALYLTVELDATALLGRARERGVRFYPAFVHCVGGVINGCADYRYAVDEEGNLGQWDALSPIYTLPRRDEPTLFTMAVTDYRADFAGFYAAFLKDSAWAESCSSLYGYDCSRRDLYGVTAMSGLRFSSFSFGDAAGKPDCVPFIVVGKYEEQEGRVTLPVFAEFAHRVNDGYHVTRFFEELQHQMDTAEL